MAALRTGAARRAAALTLALLATWALTSACGRRAERAPDKDGRAPRSDSSTGASAAAGFLRAEPGYGWSFPRDTGSHPGYRTEWWYYTGHLEAEDGRRLGYELTFFRFGLLPPGERRRSSWAARDLLFAHFAVTDLERGRFVYDERTSRGAAGLAGAAPGPQYVWIGDWSARLVGKRHRLRASQPGYRLDLRLMPLKPPVLHGRGGFSRKGEGPGRASNYYSYTRLGTEGTLWVEGRPLRVSGQSWMDHEFSTDSLSPSQVGWDWLSLQLDGNREVMLYVMRQVDGSRDPHSGGTWVEPGGASRSLTLQDYTLEETARWRSPRTGISYPSRWRVTIPSEGLEVEITPVLSEQELVTSRSTGVVYWEGAVEVRGTLRGRPLRGRGYVELTGYGGSLAGRT